MPQMSPMNWLILYSMFLMTLLIMMAKCYWNYTPCNLTINATNYKTNNNSATWSW